MNKLKLLFASFAFAALGVSAVLPVVSVSAIDNPLGTTCADNPASKICQSSGDSAGPLIGTIVNTLLFIIGLLAVVMIIVAGIMYVTSTGDSGKVTRAKNTLTYSVVGLVVAFIAFALVNWVFDLFKNL